MRTLISTAAGSTTWLGSRPEEVWTSRLTPWYVLRHCIAGAAAARPAMAMREVMIEAYILVIAWLVCKIFEVWGCLYAMLGRDDV